MSVKFKTTIDLLPNMAETAKVLNGKKVKVGAFKGDHAWL